MSVQGAHNEPSSRRQKSRSSCKDVGEIFRSVQTAKIGEHGSVITPIMPSNVFIAHDIELDSVRHA